MKKTTRPISAPWQLSALEDRVLLAGDLGASTAAAVGAPATALSAATPNEFIQQDQAFGD